MGFMQAQIRDQRRYGLFNVIDDYTEKGEVNLSLRSEMMLRSLDQIIEWPCIER